MATTDDKDRAIKLSERAAKDRDLFNDIADRYYRKDIIPSSRIPRKHRLLRTFSVVPWRPGLRVLEVGCGCGYAADYLEGLYADYVGVDYAERLVEYARRLHGRDNVRFEAADINDYRPPGPVDVVVMIGVLHHFDEPDKAFKRIVEMLKPGGWLVVNEPQSGSVFVNIARRIRTALDRDYSSDQRPFSHQRLRGLFASQNLAQVRVLPQGLFSTPLAEIPAKPVVIFGAVAKVLVFLDAWCERSLSRWMRPFSWNLIAAGQKKADEE